MIKFFIGLLLGGSIGIAAMAVLIAGTDGRL